MLPTELTLDLKREAARLGFDQVGIAPAVEPPDYAHLAAWLARGDHAEMTYMERQGPPRSHPSSILDGVKSVVMVSLLYGKGEPAPPGGTQGRVARYAQGADYHEILWTRLGALLDWLKAQVPNLQGRAIADTAPLLERDFAQRAGLGWIGKNTLLINREIGSFTVLGALLVDHELTYDTPHTSAHCGTCTRCLDACPTDAFRAPYQLDARKCLSYWTIEHKGEIPDTIAESLDEWVFGCDICQDVCPWNRKAPPARDPEMQARPEWVAPDLLSWLAADAALFSKRLKGTALSRTKRRGLIRNALLILGSRRVPEAEALVERLTVDPEPVIQKAAAWALKRIRGEP